MPTIRLLDSELKRVVGYTYRWDGSGYILMEYGPLSCHHIRMDVTPQGDRTYRLDQNDNRAYLIHEFHVKLRSENGFLYRGFNYRNGGVWRPCWGNRKTGNRRFNLTNFEEGICAREARKFLQALREVTTDMDQMLSIDAPLEMLRGVDL
jgi:hypothetical protein